MSERIFLHPFVEHEIKRAMNNLRMAKYRRNYGLFNQEVANTYQRLAQEGMNLNYTQLYNEMRKQFDSDELTTSDTIMNGQEKESLLFEVVNVENFVALNRLKPRKLITTDTQDPQQHDSIFFSFPTNDCLYASFNIGRNYFAPLRTPTDVKRVLQDYYKGAFSDLRLWEGRILEFCYHSTPHGEILSLN